MVKVIRVKAKHAITPTKLPGADYVINQYIGCQHACRYCYVKFMTRFYPYGEWGTWVVVKENLPELVKRERVKGRVYMSSVSDPYQPIERKIKLTRRILQSMDKNAELSILTKSNLVLRDIDLFKAFRSIEVGLTVNGLDKTFEPNAPSYERRITALQTLKEEGTTTYAFISPIIPHLVDVEEIIKETRDFVDFYWLEFLNLRASGKGFIQFLKDRHPESYEVLTDERKMEAFTSGVVKKVKALGVPVRGICLHYPRKECMQLR